jgi:hypothetical protein
MRLKKVRFFRLWFYMVLMVPVGVVKGLGRVWPRRTGGAVRPIRAESPSLADVPRAVPPTEEVSSEGPRKVLKLRMSSQNWHLLGGFLFYGASVGRGSERSEVNR